MSEQNAVEPIELFPYEATPFLFGAQWNGGEGYALVYDGKVQTARGLAALPPYLLFLGESRLRALSVGLLERMLEILDAMFSGSHWRPGAAHYHDLFPAIVERDGVLTYVLHAFESGHGYPPRGSKPPGAPIGFHRYSLQLWPVVSELAWKHEERFERPTPPIVMP